MVGLWIGKTGDGNAWYHIYPFVKSENTSFLHVVRYSRPQRDIVSNKIKYYTFNSVSFYSQILELIKTSIKVLRREQIDYIITFNLVPWGIIAWILAKLFRKKIIIGLIGSDFNIYVKKKFYNSAFKFVLNRCDVVTVTGLRMKDELSEVITNNDIEVYPHCLPADLLIEKEIDLNNDIINLISISSLNENKRTIDIIKAVELLVESGVNVSLDILGSGDQQDYLEEYILLKGLTSRVKFLGYHTNVKEFLLKSDLFIQASLKEGLSLSLIEAMGMEVIPIITKAGSEDDIIIDKFNGLFINKQDPFDIAQKVKYVMNRDNRLKLLKGIKSTKEKLNVSEAINKVDFLLSNYIN